MTYTTNSSADSYKKISEKIFVIEVIINYSTQKLKMLTPR